MQNIMKKLLFLVLVLSVSIVSYAQIGPITGSFNLCTGFTTTLSDTTAGGEAATQQLPSLGHPQEL
jgi:hypothetical protein